MSKIDELLKPGGFMLVTIETVSILAQEVARLREEVALWKERCESIQRDREEDKEFTRMLRQGERS